MVEGKVEEKRQLILSVFATQSPENMKLVGAFSNLVMKFILL